MSLSEPKKLLLLALLNDKKTWTELKLFLNVTDKTLSEHLKELQAKGLIKKDSEGYFLTNEGKSTLKNATLNGSEEFIRHIIKDTEYLPHEEAQIIWHFYLTCFIPDWVRR
ncbi:MAG: winged helix-turn-helix domain-containing protein, partial [Nitrososphaeria archaeon]